MDVDMATAVQEPMTPSRGCSEAVQIRVEDARRRIAEALERGAAETVIPAGGSTDDFEAVRLTLRGEGFCMTPVTGEDGPYSVVHW